MSWASSVAALKRLTSGRCCSKASTPVIPTFGSSTADRVEVTASVTGAEGNNAGLEQIVGRLSLEPSVTAARWRVET
jgi:hypothetical protein